MLYKDNILRVGTISENLPANTINFYGYNGGSTYTAYTNAAGRYYYHPCATAPGQAKVPSASGNVWIDAPVAPLISYLISPHAERLPAAYTDANGALSVAYCDYRNGMLYPFDWTDSTHPAVHNIVNADTGVTWDVSPYGDRRAVFTGAPFFNRGSYLVKASSYFMLLCSGDVTFMTNKTIRYNVKCTKRGGSVGDNYCSQKARYTESLQSGNTKYVLVQTDTLNLVQDTPYYDEDDQYKNWLFFLYYLDQPGLAVNLGNSSSVMVTSWGVDVWIDILNL